MSENYIYLNSDYTFSYKYKEDILVINNQLEIKLQHIHEFMCKALEVKRKFREENSGSGKELISYGGPIDETLSR